jgi:DNA-binding MarR family transcriptional regulator
MSNTSRSRTPRAPGPAAATGCLQGASPLDAHLGYWLRLVSNHVSHGFKQRLAREGVTVAEWVVLRALFDDDGIQPSALAERLGLSRGAISKLLGRLAAKGLVGIREDPADGRAQLVRLSASGRRAVPKLAALADENDAAVFGHLTEAQRTSLRALLESLAGRLGLRGAPID